MIPLIQLDLVSYLGNFTLDFFGHIFIYDNLFLFLPVKLYANANIQKSDIIKENKGISGVYMWENKENGYKYIGSSEILSRRFLQYYNTKHLLKNSYMVIYRALLKHGYSNFSLSILEYCEADKCLEKEQYYINLLKPEYNILPTAGSNLGYKHTEQARSKIAAARKGKKH
uniref:GIY-YIG domain-containing protein n=1 Tax=Orbilia brochopaga TaxID=3140254 RepID=A0A4Y5MV31_9PEZI|nr:hypothetical protein [Drechslerella brochopaga]